MMVAKGCGKGECKLWFSGYRVSVWEDEKSSGGASLVAQWLRIRLPTQGTRVRALGREDPTCRGATGPVSHDCWACALEPVNHNY